MQCPWQDRPSYSDMQSVNLKYKQITNQYASSDVPKDRCSLVVYCVDGLDQAYDVWCCLCWLSRMDCCRWREFVRKDEPIIDIARLSYLEIE